MNELSQHTDSTGSELAVAKQRLVRPLSNSVGKQNAMSSKELAKICGVKPTTVRDLIIEIREEYQLPIVSCTNGYFVIETDGEFRDVMDRIEREIRTRRDRQKTLCEIWYGRKYE